MGMMERMMDFMMGRMSEGEKKEMMNQMMDNFFAEMTAEDKKEMMAEMMPKMMQGVNMMEMMPKMMMGMMGGEEDGGMMKMMSDMMPGGKEVQMPMMPAMMMEMMPRCLTMILPNIPKEQRIDFILRMVETLMEQGRVGLPKEEEGAFTEKVMKKVKA